MAAFADRRAAGRALAEALVGREPDVGADLGHDPVVLALPRGGVPVAVEVADALGAPLDVLVVRKLGVPGRPEFAFGAVGEGDVRVLDPGTVAAAGLSAATVEVVTEHERAELERRVVEYRRGRAPIDLAGRPVVVVDDGLATGATARAGVRVARALGASRVVVAVPVAPPDTVVALAAEADLVVAVEQPAQMLAVGLHYADFRQVSDDEVRALLDR